VGSTEVHVQLRLLISDVFAGHAEDLFWAVKNLAIPTPVTKSQAGPRQGHRFNAQTTLIVAAQPSDRWT
jgi:hypothetical protein